MTLQAGKIIFLTGDFENGKTTFCLKLLDHISKSQLALSGVICPPVVENGRKTGIVILNVKTGELRRLAVLRGKDATDIYTNRWQFDRDSIQWGNEIFNKSIPCDVLFVDELGPLEFERREGWQNGIKAVDSRAYHLALVVVRPDLIKTALQRWPDATVVTITRENQESQLLQILKIFHS